METRVSVTCEIEWASTVPRQMRDISAPVKITRLGEGQGETQPTQHKGRDRTIRHAREQGTWGLGKRVC